MIGMLPGFEEMPAFREGIVFRFSGCEPDAEGEPIGAFVQVDLELPPLNLGALERLQDKLSKVGPMDLQSMQTILEAIRLALRRNYRGVPLWLIEQTLDLANMQDMMGALMDISGLKRKEIEAGKALAAIKNSESTGASSTVI